jgi:hypothetical protein
VTRQLKPYGKGSTRKNSLGLIFLVDLELRGGEDPLEGQDDRMLRGRPLSRALGAGGRLSPSVPQINRVFPETTAPSLERPSVPVMGASAHLSIGATGILLQRSHRS